MITGRDWARERFERYRIPVRGSQPTKITTEDSEIVDPAKATQAAAVYEEIQNDTVAALSNAVMTEIPERFPLSASLGTTDGKTPPCVEPSTVIVTTCESPGVIEGLGVGKWTLVVICVVTQNGHFGIVRPGTPAHVWL